MRWGPGQLSADVEGTKLSRQLSAKLLEIEAKPPQPVTRLADMALEKQAEMRALYPPPATMGVRTKRPARHRFHVVVGRGRLDRYISGPHDQVPLVPPRAADLLRES